MSTVHSWFPDFQDALTQRLLRSDWPEIGSEFWGDFERSLVRIGATWPLADEALSVVCDVPDLFPSQIRPMVVEAIKKLQARLNEAEAGRNVLANLEDAKLASRSCPDCLGNGATVRYVHESIHGKFLTAMGNPVPVGASASFPCSCPLGAHVARGRALPGKPAPPTVDCHPSLRRTPQRWAETADGLDNKFRYRPDDWCEEFECPYAAEHAVANLDDLRGLYRKASRRPAEARSSRGWCDSTSGPAGEPLEPIPGRPDLVVAASDPVVARELATVGGNDAVIPVATEDEPDPEDTHDYGAESAWY